MKLRWRILSKAELEEGGSGVRGAVTVRRTEHYSEQCVLEWQDTEQTQKDFWTRVDVERPTAPRRGGCHANFCKLKYGEDRCTCGWDDVPRREPNGD